MEPLPRLPWWFGLPLAAGWAVMGVFAPSMLPEWTQRVFFLLALASVVWGIAGSVWHYRSRWGRRLSTTIGLILAGVLVVALGGILVTMGVRQLNALRANPAPKDALVADGAVPDSAPRETISVELADAQAENAGGHERLQAKLREAAAPSAVALAGRVVIDQPLFSWNPNAADVSTSVRTENMGPGIAYAGWAYSNYEFVGPDRPSDLSAIVAKQIERAQGSRPARVVEMDVGTPVVFPTTLRFPRADFDEMLAQRKRLVYVIAYAYYTPSTPPDHVEIALLAMSISGLTAQTWAMRVEEQSTKTYRQIAP